MLPKAERDFSRALFILPKIDLNEIRQDFIELKKCSTNLKNGLKISFSSII